jgi:hypothetical protein
VTVSENAVVNFGAIDVEVLNITPNRAQSKQRKRVLIPNFLACSNLKKRQVMDENVFCSDEDEDDDSRPLNNVKTKHVKGNTISGNIYKPSHVRKKKFAVTSVPLPEQRLWFEIMDEFVLHILFSDETQDGVDLDAKAVRLWQMKFPDKAAEGVQPTFEQVQAVSPCD